MLGKYTKRCELSVVLICCHHMIFLTLRSTLHDQTSSLFLRRVPLLPIKVKTIKLPWEKMTFLVLTGSSGFLGKQAQQGFPLTNRLNPQDSKKPLLTFTTLNQQFHHEKPSDFTGHLGEITFAVRSLGALVF